MAEVEGTVFGHRDGHGFIVREGGLPDLYADGAGGFPLINKKTRAVAGGTIPTNFATYGGTTFAVVANDPCLDAISVQDRAHLLR